MYEVELSRNPSDHTIEVTPGYNQRDDTMNHSFTPDKETTKLISVKNKTFKDEKSTKSFMGPVEYNRPPTVIELKRFGLPIGKIKKKHLAEEFQKYSRKKETKHLMDTGLKAKKKKVNCLTLIY